MPTHEVGSTVPGTGGPPPGRGPDPVWTAPADSLNYYSHDDHTRPSSVQR
ncbi:hypothetical protein [Streptomyces sp. MP131-18]|nr:hypothetical protein [Streptomyces sp. MP131-18]